MGFCRMAVGNPAAVLPMLMSGIRESTKKRYLLLLALKEFLTKSQTKATEGADDYPPELWHLLVENDDEPEEVHFFFLQYTRSITAGNNSTLFMLVTSPR